MKVKVIQSFRNYNVPKWIKLCQQSVISWSRSNGYDYQFIGNEFFDLAPSWYTGTDKWVKSDIARLILLKKETRLYDVVVWADIDFLIFNQNSLKLDNSHGFSMEFVNNIAGINNAFMYFSRDSVELNTYYEASMEILTNNMANSRTSIGPELLSSLSKNLKLNPIKCLGLLYRPITTQLLHGRGDELEKYISLLQEPIAGANMCNFIRDLDNSNGQIFIDLEFMSVVEHLIKTEGSRLNIKWER